MKSKVILFSIIFAVVGVLIACGKDEKASNTGKEYKDEINIAITAQPPTLDTALTVSAISLDIGANIFEQLYTMDSEYKPTPLLAESVEVSEDGKQYNFKLREGVKFHNEKEMKSEDVVASMNYWLKTSSRAKALLEGAKFTEDGDYKVVLTVKKATSDVLTLMSAKAQFPSIMPKEIVENVEKDGIKEYIGTGPYKFEEWKQDQYITLIKNDEYQSVDSEPNGFTGKKEAPTNKLKYNFVSDTATRVAGIQTGKYDLADSIPTESYEQLAADKNVVLNQKTDGALTAFLNTNEGPMKDVKVRQAVLAAMNNDEIMLAAFAEADLYTLNENYVNPKNQQWSTDAGKEYYNQADVEKAKSLLSESSYEGEEITLITTKDYAEMYAGTLVVQDQLKKAGFNVKVETFDFPTFLETKNDAKKWDVFLASTGYQATPPQLLAVTPDWAGLNDDFVKTGLEKIRSAKTPEEAKEEWSKVQGHLYENATSTVIGHYSSVVATTKDVEGFVLFDSPIVWNAKVVK